MSGTFGPTSGECFVARALRIVLLGMLPLALAHGSDGQAQAPQASKGSPVATPRTEGATVPTSTHELTATDLESFLDGMMPAQLERENIAGAVISVVKDGNLLFAKGYGYADVEKRIPVNPDSTLFRPGSISKLFTWTSIMQLVEQGKVDLDKDVNGYVDFTIPPAFGKPVTLRDIMTHTAGFEETGRDLFVADAQHLAPLDQYLKRHLPRRIFAPFVVPAYSNYATALAGYIAQRVSGKPFQQYVRENIYLPLGMKHSTFDQPLPEELKLLMSAGYRKASDKAKLFEFVEAFPAGSVSTTAKDMANFMITHLQDGQFRDRQILRADTAKQMHSRTFGSDDRLNGMALGFYEESRNGLHIIGHGGDTELFHSDLHLLLGKNVGLFVSYNSAGRGEVSARSILFDKFLDRYFPYTPAAAGQVQDARADAASIAGLYKSSRRFESSFLSLLTLLGEAKVIANADRTISIDPLKGPHGELRKFEEIQQFRYREVRGQDEVGFKKNSSGHWQFQVAIPVFIFQRASFLENKYVNYSVLFCGLAIVLLTVLLWPVGALVRKHYARPLTLTPSERRLRLLVRLVCILFLVLFIGWVSVLSTANDIASINSLPPWIIIFGVLGLLCSLGTIAVLWNAVQSLNTSGRWIWAKLHDLVLALGCAGLVWFLLAWKLMNFNLNF